MTSLTKNPYLQAKNFFGVQTRRLAASFEPLIGSVALTGPEKFPRKAMWDPAVLAREFPILAGCESASKDLLTLSLLCDVRYSTMEKLSWELLIYCYVTNVTEQRHCQPEWKQMEISVKASVKGFDWIAWWARVMLLTWVARATAYLNFRWFIDTFS